MKQVKKISVIRLVVLAFAFVVAVGGLSFAQDDAEKKAPSTLVAEIESLEKDVAGLSTKQKLENSVAKIESMKQVLQETSTRLERVREEEEDLLKINCLNEKLAAIKGFLKVSEQGYGNLKEASAKDDKEAANHHYTLIAIAGQKVSSLGDEARTCAGEAVFYTGDPVTLLKVDPDIAELDVVLDWYYSHYDDAYINQRLPELTPYQ